LVTIFAFFQSTEPEAETPFALGFNFSLRSFSLSVGG